MVTRESALFGNIESARTYNAIRMGGVVGTAIRALLSIREEFTSSSAAWQVWWNELLLSCLLSVETDTTYIPPVCGAGDYHRQNFVDMSQFCDYLFPIPHVKTFDHAGDKRSKQTMRQKAREWYATVGRNRRGNVEIDKVEIKAPYLKEGKVSVRKNRLKTIANCRRQVRNGENYPIAYVGHRDREVDAAYSVFNALLETAKYDDRGYLVEFDPQAAREQLTTKELGAKPVHNLAE